MSEIPCFIPLVSSIYYCEMSTCFNCFSNLVLEDDISLKLANTSLNVQGLAEYNLNEHFVHAEHNLSEHFVHEWS